MDISDTLAFPSSLSSHGITDDFTTQRSNISASDEEFIVTTTSRWTDHEKQLELFYMISPAFFIFFLSIVVLSAICLVIKKKKATKDFKEKRKRQALGCNYGSFKEPLINSHEEAFNA